MQEIKLKALHRDYKTKTKHMTVVGMCIGAQSCYEKPSVLLTIENKDLELEIQLPREWCELVSRSIMECSAGLPEKTFVIPESNNI